MSVNRGQTIVGVFDEPAMASRTVDLLQSAGLTDAQISYLDPNQDNAGGGGGFLAGLKRLFSGPGPDIDAGDVANDLKNAGLSQDEAQYYGNQYSAGHAIIIVRPDTDEQEQSAIEILRSNGAYNYSTRSGATQTGVSTEPMNYTQTSTSTQPAGYAQGGSSAQPPNYSQTNDYADADRDIR
jgi:hypothetical protein